MNSLQNPDVMPASPAEESESLSALVDGECGPEALLALLRSGSQCRSQDADWVAYQAVGAALRQPAGADLRPPSADFAATVMARLASEALPDGAEVAEMPPPVRARAAANDEHWRWKWVAGLAACAAAAAFGWQLFDHEAAAGPELASAQPVIR